MKKYWLDFSCLKHFVSVFAIIVLASALGTQTAAQPNDPRALVGAWKGTITGSSISQADGQMEGGAVFIKRGYEDRDDFGIVLYDRRHRKGGEYTPAGLQYSHILIGGIPCGPDDNAINAATFIRDGNVQDSFAGVQFINLLADTMRDDFVVGAGGWYGAEVENPATIVTRWTDDSFILKLSGPFISTVTPVQNHTFDYERQKEAYLDHIQLDVEFILPRGTIDFERTLCNERESFDVVRTRPENGRQNVILDGANFYIEFTDELAQSSVNTENVFMTTRDRDNGYIFVDLDLSLEDENGTEDKTVIRITPREPLYPGTVYDILIAGGEDGIRGYDSEMLNEDHILSVSTMVTPDDLRMGIYQVIRDAPLVFNKPAAARIHFEWEELEAVHPDWQVQSYDVKSQILDTRDDIVFPEIRETIQRTDLYTDNDRRLGIDTLNLFDWSPSNRNAPREIRAEIWPNDHYPEDVEIDPEVITHTLEYANQHTDQLTFAYYIAEHAEWADTGPSLDMKLHIHTAARREKAFINQMFPVASVAGYYHGSYNTEQMACNVPMLSERYCKQNNGNLGMIFQLFDEHISAHTTADVLVSYHPPSLGGTGAAFAPYEQPATLINRPGETARTDEENPDVESLRRSDRGNRNLIVMSTNTIEGDLFPAVVSVPLVSHEFGHVFALPHTPYADDGAHRTEICGTYANATAANIDGLRISLSGDVGWQKSSEHGNAQSENPMRNLMFPCVLDRRSEYWIDAPQYNWLVEKLPEMLGFRRGRRAELLTEPAIRHARLTSSPDSFVWQAALNKQTEDPTENLLMISGLMDANEAVLLPATRVQVAREPLSGAGPYEIHVEDAAGQIVGRAPVGPGGESEGTWPFSVIVPITAEPSRIVLLKDGFMVTDVRAAPGLVAPQLRSHPAGGIYRVGEPLEWHGGSVENLTYTVRFTSDGQNWRTLAVFLGEPTFTPDPATLFPGPASAFEIISYDGVTERSVNLPVTIDVPLVPLAVWPDDGAVLEVDEAAVLAFNVPIDATTLDAVTLLADGALVPHQVKLDPSKMNLYITPEVPNSDVSYVAIIDSRLRAQDGRALAADVNIRFSVKPTFALSQTPAWSPHRTSITGERPRLPSPDGLAQSGTGEITLEFEEPSTIPLRVLSCVLEGNEIVRLDVNFDTPYAEVEISVTRDESGILRARASHGPEGDGDDTDGWYLVLDAGQVSARGILHQGNESIGFVVAGTCSSE